MIDAALLDPALANCTPLQIVQWYVASSHARHQRIADGYCQARIHEASDLDARDLAALSTPAGSPTALPIPEDRHLLMATGQATMMVMRWSWVNSLVTDFIDIVDPAHIERWARFGAMRQEILIEAELYYGPDLASADRLAAQYAASLPRRRQPTKPSVSSSQSPPASLPTAPVEGPGDAPATPADPPTSHPIGPSEVPHV
jgi:hypothetical protein